MAENTDTPPVAPVAPAASDTPVIAEATPAATPVVEPAAPVPAAEPVVPAKPAEAATSVMGDSAAPEAAKPEVKTEPKTETPKAEAPKAEAPRADAAPETKSEVVLPTYEDFKLPESFAPDKDALGAFTKVLGEIESGKLDHAAMQAKGQELIDLGTKAVTDAITRQNDYYVQIHEKQKTDWFDAFKADPELGGDKVGATVSAVREAIENFGGSADNIKELRQQMKDSGYGNYPPLIRLINNMQEKINSYTKETTKPVVPGAKPAPVKVKDYQRFYAGNQS